jgi:predicted  nucleic acid-binding Zn-ribbon protein
MSELPNNLNELKAGVPPLPKAEQVEAVEPTPEPKNEANKEAPDFSKTLNPENKGIFSRMKEGGKTFFNWASEKIHSAAVNNRFVSKMRMAYHGYWMNKHEEKANGFKDKISGKDSEIVEMQKSHDEIASALEELRAHNVPNMKSVEEKLRAIESKQGKLEGDKKNLQEKLDRRNERMLERTKSRDAIADQFIEKYNGKLNDIENNLTGMNDMKDDAELKASIAEVDYRKQEERLDSMQKSKEKIENALRSTGMSKVEIDGSADLMNLGDAIKKGIKSIEESRQKMENERKAIEEKIKSVSSKTQPFKDKVKEFQDIKAGKPEVVKVENAVESTTGDVSAEGEGSDVESVVEEGSERMKVNKFVEEFNKFINPDKKIPAPVETVNTVSFFGTIKKLGLGDMEEVSFKEFKFILANYFKVIKLKTNRNVNDLLESFYNKNVKI